MNTKIQKEFDIAMDELREATAKLASLGNEYEAARALAQKRVTMSTAKLSALLSIEKSQTEALP